MAEGESSVRVAVRIRPLISREKIDMCRVCTSVTPGEPQVWLGSDKAFTFDYLFDMHSEQQHIYEQSTHQLIEGCLEGYNATVLAYGQTGSGKTYTMGTGFEVDAGPELAGIVPRAADQLFRGIQQRVEAARLAAQPPPDFKVSASFMELYNEDIIDLLDQTDASRGRKSNIRIQEDAGGGICAVGLTSRAVASTEHCLKCLRAGALSRTTASTQMNQQSSRSHAIFTLSVKQMRLAGADSGFAGETESESGLGSEPAEQRMEFETLSAKFHFVDLAGSERLKRTGATGDRAKEGISINCGLLALGNVISALGDESKKSSHVPYRDSKLTRLLQDSLGGNSRTLMIACVSPSDADFMETLNTLKYANRARNIRNKVSVNQDKTSRTMALLRQEIQQLQLELLEYRQGKRAVTEDGGEAINDMFHENKMLQTENHSLRTRVKAVQSTLQTMTARNLQLLAERAAGEWEGADPNGDVTQVVTKYLQEIEDLRARLLESESTCQQLTSLQVNRLTPSARPATSDSVWSSGAVRSLVRRYEGLSPPCLDGTYTVARPATAPVLSRSCSESSVDTELTGARPRPAPQSAAVSPPTASLGGMDLALTEPGSVTELIEEARRDLALQRNQSRRRRSSSSARPDRHREQDSSDSTDQKDSDPGEESDREDSMDECEGEDKEVDHYGEQLAELSSEISVKQRLIDELERSQRRMDTMRQHYEEKLLQLTARIRATELERDNVISNISGKRPDTSSDDIKKVKDDYERRLSDMGKDLRKLQSAQREHAKLVRSKGQYERQVKQLKSEIVQMKKIKVKLMQKMKEDANKMKQMDLQHHRAVSQLRKEHRKHENQIKSLEAEKRMKDAVLKRKQEEITALRKLGKVERSRNSRIRGGKGVDTSSFSPAAAKKRWQTLEKSINQLALNKQTVGSMEREMERQLQDRECLRRRLERVVKQRDQVVMAGWPHHQMQELDETIEGIRANMDYINDNINDCQASIMALEESKEGLPVREPAQLVQNLGSVELEYLLQKLVAMTIHQSCLTAQHEAASREVELKMEQMELNSSVQQQLLRHLLTERAGVDPVVLSLISEAGRPLSDGSDASDQELGDIPAPWAPPPAKDKARRKTATTNQLLFANGSSGSPAAAESARLRGGGGDAESGLVEPPPPALSSPLSHVVPIRESADRQPDATPPGSPLAYRRQTSRQENVFSRLTSSTVGQLEDRPDTGVITAYQGGHGRAPLVCSHVAEGHAKPVLSVCATNDMLLSGSKDRTVKVWDLATGQQVQSLTGHPNNVVCVRYCEVEQLAFSVSSAFVKVWDLREAPAKCVKTLSSSGLTSTSVPLSTPSRTLQVPAGEAHINDICLNSSGRALYTASLATVRMWDLRKFHSVAKLSGGHQAAIMCLAVDRRRGADLVLTGSKDHSIKGFQVADDSSGIVQASLSLTPPHYDGIQCLVVTGDCLFSGSRDACIKQWHIERGALLQSVSSAHRDWICGMTLVPGGQALLSGCRSGTVKLWGVDACHNLGELKAHNSQINAITSNQSHVFTASNDHTIRLWRGRNNLDVGNDA